MIISNSFLIKDHEIFKLFRDLNKQKGQTGELVIITVVNCLFVSQLANVPATAVASKVLPNDDDMPIP